jgi:hypothetical protein
MFEGMARSILKQGASERCSHSGRSQPYLQIFDKAGEVWQGQTLKLIGLILFK